MNTMNDSALSDAFEQCLQAVRGGRPIEETVRAYPQFADDLRAMLEIAHIVQTTAPSAREVAQAQTRVYARLEGYQRARRRTVVFPIQRLAAAAVLILVVGLALWQGPQILSTIQNAARSTATATQTLLTTQTASETSTVLTNPPTATSSATVTPTITPTPLASLVQITTLTRTPTRYVPAATRVLTQRPPAPTNPQPTSPPAATDDHHGGGDDSGHGGSDGSGSSGSGSGGHSTPGGSSGGLG